MLFGLTYRKSSHEVGGVQKSCSSQNTTAQRNETREVQGNYAREGGGECSKKIHMASADGLGMRILTKAIEPQPLHDSACQGHSVACIGFSNVHGPQPHWGWNMCIPQQQHQHVLAMHSQQDHSHQPIQMPHHSTSIKHPTWQYNFQQHNSMPVCTLRKMLLLQCLAVCKAVCLEYDETSKVLRAVFRTHQILAHANASSAQMNLDEVAEEALNEKAVRTGNTFRTEHKVVKALLAKRMHDVETRAAEVARREEVLLRRAPERQDKRTEELDRREAMLEKQKQRIRSWRQDLIRKDAEMAERRKLSQKVLAQEARIQKLNQSVTELERSAVENQQARSRAEEISKLSQEVTEQGKRFLSKLADFDQAFAQEGFEQGILLRIVEAWDTGKLDPHSYEAHRLGSFSSNVLADCGSRWRFTDLEKAVVKNMAVQCSGRSALEAYRGKDSRGNSNVPAALAHLDEKQRVALIPSCRAIMGKYDERRVRQAAKEIENMGVNTGVFIRSVERGNVADSLQGATGVGTHHQRHQQHPRLLPPQPPQPQALAWCGS